MTGTGLHSSFRPAANSRQERAFVMEQDFYSLFSP
jgi:hypothetical protein